MEKGKIRGYQRKRGGRKKGGRKCLLKVEEKIEEKKER
jgi:hypothetical protein